MVTLSSPLSDNKTSSRFQRHLFTLVGKVIQDKLDKTITVDVAHKFRHPIYQKTIFKNKKYLVHDPLNQAKINDQVVIANTRRLSARKSFYLLKIIKTTFDKEKVSVKTTETSKTPSNK